ncbi:DUF3037 domain-containing protein [Necropsobacter massiliensis]|uniref:DUF3037 domain-containing protein n=1 Tax=Necropsobacter massiliensis TaxID=1400001 RepID=UPI000596020F|nr:DUF3037 domain-containing protein [Necropsobacter massiliensis]
MKTPILYSFVRFLPFFESGEFVNIGLLMCEPNAKKLTYRIVKKNDIRVNHFFRQSKIFYDVHPMINEQLRYIVDKISSVPFNTNDEMINFFHHYTEQKDGLFQFSNAAVGLVDDPVAKFNELYEKFIKGAGVATESQELHIVREYKKLFKAQNDQLLAQYKEQLVQGSTAKFKFPLALQNESTKEILKGIKPLAFDQAETSGMIEHCDSWVAKINRASEEGLLKRDNILFTLDTADTDSKMNILTTIKHTFDKFKLQHTDWQDNKNILAFAQDIKM